MSGYDDEKPIGVHRKRRLRNAAKETMKQKRRIGQTKSNNVPGFTLGSIHHEHGVRATMVTVTSSEAGKTAAFKLAKGISEALDPTRAPGKVKVIQAAEETDDGPRMFVQCEILGFHGVSSVKVGFRSNNKPDIQRIRYVSPLAIRNLDKIAPLVIGTTVDLLLTRKTVVKLNMHNLHSLRKTTP